MMCRVYLTADNGNMKGSVMKHNDVTQLTIKKLLESHPVQMRERVKLHRDQIIIYIIKFIKEDKELYNRLN